MTIRKLDHDDSDQLVALFRELSDHDLTMMRGDLYDLDAAARLCDDPQLRWVAVSDDGDVTGYACVDRLPGWSSHVGELRIVVAHDARRLGIGRLLAQAAVTGALATGVDKLVIELDAEADGPIGTFLGLGFTGEALLRDQIRDRSGHLHDIVTLALHANTAAATAQVAGLPTTFH
ncbi:GNAT family N-acetyltransferase [Gordonia sp. TBRC 11910]|uniref:GNAT family N-acetyltransferase n=1 Tax=Gordonia asplenii TaxID=2725283 RepID=A0A848KQ19_9ACTN|nr:GNAT family N-acetyltransferase [Gordonia asplenii]NMO00047.1 GNAT family N-acetyltransferase [Gordonia asplenii]